MNGKQRLRPTQRKRTMSLATWNVQGIRTKITEITREVKKLDIDITALTETKKKGVGMEDSEDFIIIHSGVPKEERAQRGVAFLIKKKYKRHITNFQAISENILKIHMSIRNRKLAIFAIYAPSEDEHVQKKEEFYEQLQAALDEVGDSREKILMGDFNARIGSKTGDKVVGPYGENTVNNNGGRLIDLCTQNQLKISNGHYRHKDIHKYTWRQPSRQLKSIIDYIITGQTTSFTTLDTRVYRGAECGSDHHLLKSRLYFPLKKQPQRIIEENEENEDEMETITENKYNIEKLQEESTRTLYQWRLEEKLQEGIYEDINELHEHIKRALHEATYEAVGTVEVGRKKSSNIWWNDSIEEEVERKKFLYLKWLNSKEQRDRQEYVNQRNEVNRLVSKSKTDTWDRKCQEIEQHIGGRRCTEAWKFINSVRKDKRQIPIKTIRGKEWEEYFKDLLTENRQMTTERIDNVCVRGENHDIPIERISKAINALKNRKASGPGGITSEMIKYGTPKLQRMITTLFNKCMDSGTVPLEWKIGYLTPIHKKGDTRIHDNYRGITVTPTFSRLYGRVIRDMIEEEYTNHEAEEQCGFRAGRSCVDNLFCLKQIIEKRLERGRDVHLLFIDLTKAYDSVPVEKLWESMEKTNICNTLIKTVKELYRDNIIKIKNSNRITKGFKPTKGLKQGCCMAPTLFKIYIEDALNKWKRKCENMGIPLNNKTIYTLQFADDQVILAQDKDDLEYMSRKIKEEYEKAGLNMNLNKTKYLCIGNETTDLELENNEQIKTCDSYKYLGVRIDKDGRDEREIRERIGQGRRAIKRLNSIWWSREISKQKKYNIYDTVVKSIVTYGSETWRCNEADRKRLNAVEMDALRRSCRISRMDRVSNETIRERMGNRETINEYIDKKQLIWFGHVKRMPEDRLPRMVLEWTPTERRKPGRPKKRWEQGIKRAMSDRNIQENLWQDRQKWRKSLEIGQRRRTL